MRKMKEKFKQLKKEYKENNTAEITYCTYCTDCTDCNYCHHCEDCFMCTWLHNKRYCILNKQYTKEEYEAKMQEINTKKGGKH